MKPQDVLDAAAETFGLKAADLTGPSRTQIVVAARQAAMLILRDYIPWLSLQDIGRVMRRDHTTIIYGVATARERGRAEVPYQQAVLEALARARAA